MFHFCSHSWLVEDTVDGTRVTLSHRDLDAASLRDLVDDLLGVVLESGRPILYLDLGCFRKLDKPVLEEMAKLHARLAEHGCRLILVEVHMMLHDALRAAGMADTFDMRVATAAETIS